jgi:excisionase family DNA binding protein
MAGTATTDRKFLTSFEAAQLLRVSMSTLRIWVRRGIVPTPARFGHRRLFDEAKLMAAVERSEMAKV